MSLTRKEAAVPHYFDAFIAPIRDNNVAQVLVTALLIGIVMDVVLGLVSAALCHEIKPSKMREGIQRKIAELGILVAADIIDGMLSGGFQLGIAPVLVSTASFLSLMELFSICENCIKMNPDFVDVPLVGTVARLLHEAKGGNDEQL